MAGMVGMDVNGVRALSKLMLTKADEIDTAVNGITKQLNSVKWVGNDANRFRNDWNGHLSASVKKVTEALRQAGRQAKRDADEQERASS